MEQNKFRRSVKPEKWANAIAREASKYRRSGIMRAAVRQCGEMGRAI